MPSSSARGRPLTIELELSLPPARRCMKFSRVNYHPGILSPRAEGLVPEMHVEIGGQPRRHRRLSCQSVARDWSPKGMMSLVRDANMVQALLGEANV